MRANIFVFFMILLISGCGGGSSGSNGPDPFNPGTDPVISLSIALLDENCSASAGNSVTADETICVQATLTSDGAASSDQVVSFAVDSAVATLSASSALTNSSGVAQITLSSTNGSTGAATITATFGSSTASQSFEFTSGTPAATVALNLVVLDGNCQTVTEPVFTTDQTICVRATLTSDNVPQAEEVVSFSLTAGIGNLSNTTALTDANGVAEVAITNAGGTTGANTITAAFGSITESTNYEYIAGSSGPVVALTTEVLNAECQAVQEPVFTTNQSICVRALLTSNGTPVSGELITFALATQIGALDNTTVLTNNSGIAEVNITNVANVTGATTVTATFGTISSGSNYEYVPISTAPVIALSVDVLSASCQAVTEPVFTSDLSICVQATLTSDGQALSGELVSFSLGAAIGTLNNTTALTNANGVAEVVISNANNTTGATSVTASFGTVSNSANYEYTEANPNPGTPSIALELIVDGGTNNRFEAGQNVAIRAVFLDASNSPVPDAIINFSVNSATITITPGNALTDNTGTARATMVATAADIGANVLTATGTFENTTFTSTLNFEVLEATGNQGSPELAVAVLNAQCEAEDQSFASNETICVRATLTRNNEPLTNEIVSFALSANLGTLSADTALTNAEGIAEVTITNATTSVGAATLSANFDTVSNSVNYEYVAVNETVSESPVISVEVILTGNAVNGFQAGQEVIARSTVLDSDRNAVSGIIVTFSIQGNGPVLTPATALTNAQGIAEVDLTATENDLGAYALQADATVSDIQISNSVNFEVRSAGAVIDSLTRFGHINSNGVFVEGQVGSSIEDQNGNVTISAGATTGFDVALVDENDNRITTPTPVTFTTTCVTNGEATIDETVTTINGVASATFEDLSCAGATGNTDQVVATVVINNVTATITREITILPEDIGAISFVSATPTSIVLSGTGGQNNASVSSLLFQVNGELGNPLAQQEVSFSLNTTAGGLSLDPASGLTNSSGQVSTRVTAGTVPTPVRVTASVQSGDGQSIQTQSDLLSVNTGLPDQNSFTVSASTLNPEAANISGQTVTITARLADAFNNPVPNGTTVNFTTESGRIDATCQTGQNETGQIDPTAGDTGTCSVTWESQLPISEDHRSTLLAYAIGHETLFDANGNNAYDDSDGGPILDGTDSGRGISQYGQTGFVDHSEAWLDIDEDRFRDGFEPFIPFNDNGIFDPADGLFNGPQCNSETRCDPNARSIHIRRSLVLITSSSTALWRVYAGSIANSGNIVATNDSSVTITNPNASENQYTLADNTTETFTLVYYDTAGQILAAGTQLGSLDADGNISIVVDTVNNTNQNESSLVPGSVEQFATLTNVAGAEDSGTTSFSFAIDAPSGTRTNVDFSVVRADP